MTISEILSLISLISFALAVVSLIVAVFIWFKFEIPAVISDLSGRTAKKSIQRLREDNEKSGKKVFKSSTTNIERGMLTDTMPDSETLREDESEFKKRVEIASKQLKHNPKVNKSVQSKALRKETEETGLLANKEVVETDLLQTGVLGENEQVEFIPTEETGLLVEENTTNTSLVEKIAFSTHKRGVELVILEEVIFVHTDEVIQ